jgi:hypothetical protein
MVHVLRGFLLANRAFASLLKDHPFHLNGINLITALEHP